jgi:hypothetical protein
MYTLPHLASYMDGKKALVSKNGVTIISSLINLNVSSEKLSIGDIL